jgi:hypothetical protein
MRYLPITDRADLNARILGLIAGDEETKRALIEVGPLCLLDVSRITDFASVCGGSGNAALPSLEFSSDLFWNTGAATVMSAMFSANTEFKGYIGTWDVSNVVYMDSMFEQSGIEDGGIANWTTTSLFYASSMFGGAKSLSSRLDLRKWRFSEKLDTDGATVVGPDMDYMFAESGIVDCGIGEWDVRNAAVHFMLDQAEKFTAYRSLLEQWPETKVDDAKVPEDRKKAVPSPVSFGTSLPMTDGDIVRYLAHCKRTLHRRAKSAKSAKSTKSQECSIL